MASKYRSTFFDSKRPWSVYKDKVLDYYLRPYLAKVKTRNAPITVVDMCAGRGEFKTGEPGSPLIIARHLEVLASQGAQVRLRCYENLPQHYEHLEKVLKPYAFATSFPKDCFTDIDEIADIASRSSLLLYIDPCDVSQLDLSQLALIYDKVTQGSSVEVLTVFMAKAFVRQAGLALSQSAKLEDAGALHDPLVRDADEDDKAMWLHALYGVEADRYSQSQASMKILANVLGSDAWTSIVSNDTLEGREKYWRVIDVYRKRLKRWFKVVEALPIHADMEATIPKYWIVFSSRYAPAFDLFNRAACDVTRLQRQNYRGSDGLFTGTERQPDPANPATVDRAVRKTAKSVGKVRWEELRWRTCGDRCVGSFTDSEVNNSIKRLLKEGWLAGATGAKVEEKAVLTPTKRLDSWIER